MTEASGRTREWLIFAAKLLVTAVLVGFVLSRLSLTEIRGAMSAPHWGLLIAALGVYGLSAVAGAQQWAWLLHAGGITAASGEIRRLYFIGLFFNNFLPANIGGDAYKIIDLGRREQRALGVFCATLLDRLIGLGAMTALAVLVLCGAALADIALPGTTLLLIPALALLFVLLAVLLSRRLGRLLPRVLARVGLARLAAQTERVTAELARFRSRVRFLNGIFVFSMLVQLLRLATHVLVALGLGFALSGTQMVQLLVLVPMVAISLTVPVTINGIGLRESVSAELLTAAGLLAPQAVAMGVAAYLVQVVFSLVGGVLLLTGRRGQPQAGN